MSLLPPAGNTSKTHPENRAFYPALDGLRAVAFLLVFGQHYLSLAWGWTGVNIFFVLSGFLITGILFDSRDDLFRVRNFYLRRTLRIFPLYYGVFVVLLVLAPFAHWNWNAWWFAWPLYLGNLIRFLPPRVAMWHSILQFPADAHISSARLPNTTFYFGHLWSLCVEEQFYLIWPWVVFWIRDRRKLIGICTLVVAVGPFFRVALEHLAPGYMIERELLYRFTPAQFDALLLGGLIALMWRGSARAQLLVVARVVAVLGTLAVAWFLAFKLHGWRMIAAQYPHWKFTTGLTYIDLYAGSLIVCALVPGSFLYRLLGQRPLRWVGRLSYGAYVFHDVFHGFYVHAVVHSLIPIPGPYQEGAAAALALAGTLFLAWLSFRVYESRFLNLKDRFTRPNTASAATA